MVVVGGRLGWQAVGVVAGLALIAGCAGSAGFGPSSPSAGAPYRANQAAADHCGRQPTSPPHPARKAAHRRNRGGDRSPAELSDAAAAFERIVHRDRARAHGATNIVLANRRGAVLVYWHGRVPQQIRNQVRQYQQRTSPRPRLVFRPARFTKAELGAAQHRVLTAHNRYRHMLSVIFPDRRGNGISIGINLRLTPAVRQQARRVFAVAARPVPILKVQCAAAGTATAG